MLVLLRQRQVTPPLNPPAPAERVCPVMATPLQLQLPPVILPELQDAVHVVVELHVLSLKLQPDMPIPSPPSQRLEWPVMLLHSPARLVELISVAPMEFGVMLLFVTMISLSLCPKTAGLFVPNAVTSAMLRIRTVQSAKTTACFFSIIMCIAIFFVVFVFPVFKDSCWNSFKKHINDLISFLVMDVRVVEENLESFKSELIVVGLCKGSSVPEFLKKVDSKLDGVISHVLKTREFEGDFGQFRLVSTLGKLPSKSVFLFGLGESKDLTLDLLRRSAGLSAKIVRDVCGVSDLATVLHTVEVPNTSKEQRAQAVTEGTVLASYQFIKYRTVDKDKIRVLKKVTLVGDGVEQSVRKGMILADCANLVRDLANEPASNLHPKELADAAKELEKLGVKVTVHDKKSIEKIGLTALLAVNRGSVHEPRFVIMEYKGGGKKKVAFVGKGITFDSGGLNIKPEDGMLTMKHDMTGAAVVIAAVRAAAQLKIPVNLIGVFAATENMPGMDAYKQGDVVQTFSGKTIEIANTDAEGRVILSDALAYTEKTFAPDIMVDLATLTGAVSVALGSPCAGVMGPNQEVIDALVFAGKSSGERLWQLPFFREYHDQVKSDIADVRNLGILRREAGAITAGAFLNAFVQKTPWAHIDIAGVSWVDADFEYIKRGATGFGVRMLIAALENWK